MQKKAGMQSLLDNLRLLDAAQGYATLGMYMQSNQELEQMTVDSRLWPEVLAIKLTIFDGLKLWDMVELTAMQLRTSANGKRRWLRIAEKACREMRAARMRENLFAREKTGAKAASYI
jgi:hypothetical protein